MSFSFRVLIERELGALYAPQAAVSRWDWGVAIGLGGIGLAIAALAQSALSAALFQHMDTYFQADPPRVLESMFDRMSEASDRSVVHPAFSILTWPLGQALTAFGMTQLAAAKAMVLTCAAATPMLLYFAFRALGLPLTAAALFVGVLLASATFIHWFAMVDTFAFGAASVSLMILVLTRARPESSLLWIVSSALTLAVTTTNWGIGLAASFVRLPWRVFLVRSTAVLGLIAILSLAQTLVFPHARLFFDLSVLAKEKQFVQLEREASGGAPWTPTSNLRSAIVTSAVAPTPTVFQGGYEPTTYDFVNNQYSSLGSTPKPGLAAIACWLLLLAIGAWGLLLHRPARRVGLALGAYLAMQLMLHLFYGDLTFLYAGNFFPALLGIAAFGWFTPARRVSLALAAGFVVLAGVSNAQVFQVAAGLANGIVN